MISLFGLSGRDKDTGSDIVKFIQRQLYSENNTEDFSLNGYNRSSGGFAHGYIFGFCADASSVLVHKQESQYKKKFVQFILDKLENNASKKINGYILAATRIDYCGGDKRKISGNLEKGIEKFLPEFEMFCHGWWSGKKDLSTYVDRSNCELLLKKFILTGEYEEYRNVLLKMSTVINSYYVNFNFD